MSSIKPSKQRHIFNNILETIGNTPLIRINKLTKELGIECEVLVKCEFFNPTGSHKDRLALNLINTAEAEGKLKPGGTIIEATSGNTGLGLCLVAAIRGYHPLMVAQQKTSQEKLDLIRGLGADIVVGKSNSPTDPEGSIMIAERLSKITPNSIYTEQFSNPANPATHLKSTGIEIFEQCGGKLDYFFMAVGTGGTITGTGKALKELDSEIKVIGCDPVGSLIATPEGTFAPFKVEGIGRDVMPPNCDTSIIDDWVKFKDKDAFDTARKVMRLEGIMCGGSAGGVLWSALHYAQENRLGKDKTLVVFMPDTSRNYLSSYMNNEWMMGNGFLGEEEYRHITMESEVLPEKHYGDELRLSDLRCKSIDEYGPECSISKAWPSLQKSGIVMVKNGEKGGYKGVVTDKDALAAVSAGRLTMADPISKLMRSDHFILNKNLKLSTAAKILGTYSYFLFDNNGIYISRISDVMDKLSSIIPVPN